MGIDRDLIDIVFVVISTSSFFTLFCYLNDFGQRQFISRAVKEYTTSRADMLYNFTFSNRSGKSLIRLDVNTEP